MSSLPIACAHDAHAPTRRLMSSASSDLKGSGWLAPGGRRGPYEPRALTALAANLIFGRAQTRVCLLVSPLQLAKPHGTRGPGPVCLRLIQLIALAGETRPGSQVFEMLLCTSRILRVGHDPTRSTA